MATSLLGKFVRGASGFGVEAVKGQILEQRERRLQELRNQFAVADREDRQEFERETLESGGGDPAGLRTIKGIAEYGDFDENERKRQARVAAGLEGRESSAGFKFFTFSGDDGKERTGRFNQATGKTEIFDGRQWVQAGGRGQAGIGGEPTMPAGRDAPTPDAAEAPAGKPSAEKSDGDVFVSRTPEEQARLTAENTPPKGYRFNENGRLVPQEGSPEARKLQQTKKAARETLGRKVPGILRDVNRAIEESDKAGPIAGAFADPGEGAGRFSRATAAASPAFELKQHLDSIKSNISIDELQSMREASPTGGALGQVPVRQQEFLMQVQGALLPTLDPEVLRENIKRVHNNYLDLYLNALYGDELEWQQAIEDGRANEADMQTALREKQELRNKYMKETEFGEFGQRTDNDQQTNVLQSNQENKDFDNEDEEIQYLRKQLGL